MAKWLAKPAVIATTGCEGSRLARAPPTIACVLKIISLLERPRQMAVSSSCKLSLSISSLLLSVVGSDILRPLGRRCRNTQIGRADRAEHSAHRTRIVRPHIASVPKVPRALALFHLHLLLRFWETGAFLVAEAVPVALAARASKAPWPVHAAACLCQQQLKCANLPRFTARSESHWTCSPFDIWRI